MKTLPVRPIDFTFTCCDCGCAIPNPGNPNKRKDVRCLPCKAVHKMQMQRIRRLKTRSSKPGLIVKPDRSRRLTKKRKSR
jgi:hypothetical protein